MSACGEVALASIMTRTRMYITPLSSGLWGFRRYGGLIDCEIEVILDTIPTSDFTMSVGNAYGSCQSKK